MTDCMSHECLAPKARGTSLLRRVLIHFKTRAQQRRDRAAFQYLLQLDPHILKDIGVSGGCHLGQQSSH